MPGFSREVDENFSLLGYYAASSGNSLPTFRNNLSVPYSGVKNPLVTQQISVWSYGILVCIQSGV